jgi:hypothetical protein
MNQSGHSWAAAEALGFWNINSATRLNGALSNGSLRHKQSYAVVVALVSGGRKGITCCLIVFSALFLLHCNEYFASKNLKVVTMFVLRAVEPRFA